ncbi:MAG: GNAT family N-acetyltransferase [Verrucomicrobiota bacterium]
MNFPRIFEIKTSRCRLRAPTEEDIPHVFSATRFEGFNDGMLWDAPEREEELRRPLEDGRKAWDEGRAYGFTIESLQSKKFIGRIGIRRTDEEDVWNIGFWTHPRYQRRGYMTESVAAVLGFGFEELNAIRIEACHALWNIASERVLKKSGMTFIRHIPKGFKKKDEWIEENLLGISSNDWRKRKIE